MPETYNSGADIRERQISVKSPTVFRVQLPLVAEAVKKQML